MGHIAGMKLLDHLKAVDKTVPDFADELQEPRNTIRKIVYGQRQPSLELAVKIAKATNGDVAVEDMVLPARAAA